MLTPGDDVLLVGDACVTTKAGTATYGVDRCFSSIAGKPVPEVSLFALALVSRSQRQAFPVQIEQVVREPVTAPYILPEVLAPIWAGCGGAPHAGNAALTLQLALDLCTGRLYGPQIHDGRESDRNATRDRDLPPSAVRIVDLGFWDLMSSFNPCKLYLTIPIRVRMPAAQHGVQRTPLARPLGWARFMPVIPCHRPCRCIRLPAAPLTLGVRQHSGICQTNEVKSACWRISHWRRSPRCRTIGVRIFVLHAEGRCDHHR